ncbi:hypothetical protein [Streptomyces sp. OE57]|uniref:hypothetical protein n=1 Tax=Streptomyces lacaronensis TaxID=3379885 RepID=UPI0039B77A4D
MCRELGYTTTRKALLDHVPEERRESPEIAVHDCLRFLQKHRCIRQNGLTDDGNPVYMAGLPPA